MSVAASDHDQDQRLLLALTVAIGAHALLLLGLQFRALLSPPEQPVYSLNVALIDQTSGQLQAAVAVAEQTSRPQPEPPPEPQPVPAPASPPPPLNSTTEPLISTVRQSVLKTPLAIESEVLREPPIAIPTPTPTPQVPSEPVEQRPPPLNLSVANALSLSPRAEDRGQLDSGRLQGAYAERWRRTVEQAAVLNFPESLRHAGITGRLTLEVAVRSDGSVESITMLRSSGYPKLDRAARQIVYLAAPFAPFPDSLRRRLDVIHIVRTWEFNAGQQLPGDGG